MLQYLRYLQRRWPIRIDTREVQEKMPTALMLAMTRGERTNVCRLEMIVMLVTFAVNPEKCALAVMLVLASVNLSKEQETRRRIEIETVITQVKVMRGGLQITGQTMTGAEVYVLRKDRIVTSATSAAVAVKNVLAVTSPRVAVKHCGN